MDVLSHDHVYFHILMETYFVCLLLTKWIVEKVFARPLQTQSGVSTGPKSQTHMKSGLEIDKAG